MLRNIDIVNIDEFKDIIDQYNKEHDTKYHVDYADDTEIILRDIGYSYTLEYAQNLKNIHGDDEAKNIIFIEILAKFRSRVYSPGDTGISGLLYFREVDVNTFQPKIKVFVAICQLRKQKSGTLNESGNII